MSTQEQTPPKRKTLKEKKRQNENSISAMWDHIKQPNMCAERREGTDKIFDDNVHYRCLYSTVYRRF